MRNDGLVEPLPGLVDSGNGLRGLRHPAVREFSYSALAETTIGVLRSWAPAKRGATLFLTLIGFSDRSFDASEIAAVEVVAGSVQQRGCTCSASTAMRYWIEEKSTKANYMTKPKLFQLVEMKGKCFSSIAPIIYWPKNQPSGLVLQNLMKTIC